MSRNWTAAQAAATVAGRTIKSNADALGVAAEVATGKKARRVKAVKMVALPPSTLVGDVATIITPLPPKSLHPNSQSHWRAKLKAKVEARDAGTKSTMEALKGVPAPMWAQATLHIDCYLTTRARADKDNVGAWAKNTIDGICLGGLIANDHGLDAPSVSLLADRTCPRMVFTFKRKEE